MQQPKNVAPFGVFQTKNISPCIFIFDRVDDSDNEEINELSRLQDPSNQDAQVGGSINGQYDADKTNLSTADNSLVPSDQNQSSSDALANISDFLKNKESEGTGPGRQVPCLVCQTVTSFLLNVVSVQSAESGKQSSHSELIIEILVS